ncbi:MAG: aspartate aminotransferase family protein [Chloroflexi bacterium]|nr:aspartate aminotransferase family protein [Chloroflexota bacterium]
MPDTWQELEAKYFLRTGGRRLKVTVERGQGAYVWDTEGKRYLDFVGGWAVTSLGHCHPALVEAITQQAQKLFIASNDLYTIPQVQLAEWLVTHSVLDRVFFSNSGAEANEGAIKLAKKYGKLKKNGAFEFITALQSFHGRTLTTTAATGHPEYHVTYTPLPPGFKLVPYNDIEAIKQATTEQTVAIMLEPVQGEGGVNVPAPDYLKQVRAWCDQNGLLLILDEVQTGAGRLGTLWGYESFGVEPDIMTLAKGMGGGIPVAALTAKEHCAVFTPGDHGTTYGGNPLATAGALAVLSYLVEHDIPANAARLGEYLRGKLRDLGAKHPFITEVRGMGLLNAVQFDRDISMDVVNRCIEEGFLVNPVSPSALRLMPPLNITTAEADEAVDKLDRALSKVGAAATA